jgi:hypothetical protein
MSLPMIAWVSRTDGLKHLGSVIDVLSTEIDVFLSEGKDEINNFISSIRSRLVHFGKPSEVPTFTMWEELRPDLIYLGKAQQQIASICHTDSNKYDAKLLSNLNNKKAKTFDQIRDFFELKIKSLANQLFRKGDKRLMSPEAVARDFYDLVFFQVSEASKNKGASMEAFIKQFALLPTGIDGNLTLKDFKRIVTRQKKMAISVKPLGFKIEDVWPELKNNLMPSEIIIYEIRKSRKNALRASGSDLNDDYISSLVPYLDAVTVDKRTYEYLKQAEKRNPKISVFTKSIIKASDYNKLPEILKKYERG